MRRLFFMIGLTAFGLLCCAQSNRSHCPCKVGRSCTTDKGRVTAACGIQSTPQKAPASGKLYSYGASPFASFSDAFQPTMDVYYPTADGASNLDPTVIILPTGGNATAGTDWSAGFNNRNGSQPAAGWALIDGTAFTGTPAAGTHYNMVVPQTQSYPGLRLNAGITAGASSLSIANAAHHYFPTGTPYTICVDYTNQECFPVSSTGSPYSPPFTVNITGTFANDHSSGAPVWAEDSNGQGGPTYPTYYKWSICDVTRLMSYLNGVIGNKHYVLWAISGTTSVASSVIAYGKTLENMAAPEGCGYSSADTSWVVDASQLVSPLPDMGTETNYAALNGVQSQTPNCSNRTISGTPASFIMGPYSSLNGGRGSFTLPNPLTYSHGALDWSSPNALAAAGRNLSLVGCLPGVANDCFYSSNADGFLGKVDIEGGADDTANPCPPQQAYLGSGPGASGLIQASVGHGANFTVNEAGGSNCGTSASNGTVCKLSYVVQNFYALLGTLRADGPATPRGAALSGAEVR